MNFAFNSYSDYLCGMANKKSLADIIKDASASIDEIEKEVGKKVESKTADNEMDGLEYYTKLKNEGYSSQEIEEIISGMLKNQG